MAAQTDYEVSQTQAKSEDIYQHPWKPIEITAFRFFAVYFLIQIIPLDWKYYQRLFSIDWSSLGYGDIFQIARYYPRFLSGPDTFLNWVIAGLIAVAVTIWWNRRQPRVKEYTEWYYWLRVLVRYRLAAGVIAYGFLKFFPLQAPRPSLSHLNTAYGDLSAWKIFSLSLGIVPSYQVFLGGIEILAGLLLLFRKTATIGAFIIFIFLGNVFVSNLAYEGGEHVYSLYLLFLALFLLAFDAPRLVCLLGYGRATEPNLFNPVFHIPAARYGRWAVKAAFLLFFVVLYGARTRQGAASDPYQVPVAAGLEGSAGVYKVSEFTVDGDTIPHHEYHPFRWQQVVFEEWATLSIKSNRRVIPIVRDTEEFYKGDFDRKQELSGTIGRHYYSYEVNPEGNTLRLRNKNDHYQGEELIFRFERPRAGTLILSGLNENGQNIRAVLEKLDKKYLLYEVEKTGRRGGLIL